MEDFLNQYSMYILLGVFLIAMMWFSSRSRQKAAQKQQEHERQLAENLVPGAWVHTAVGFWGRFVDEDGDIIILETIDGTEMYWDRRLIREVGVQPPFEAESAEADDEEEPQQILGLDTPSDSVEEEKN